MLNAKTLLIVLFIIIASIIFGYLNLSKNDDSQQKPKNVPLHDTSFTNLEKEVVAIFENSCSTAGCHRGKYPKKNLNLEKDQFKAALIDVPSKGIPTYKLVDTSNLDQSYLLMKIKNTPGIVGDLMPIEAPPLKKEKIDIIESWIRSIRLSPEKETVQPEKS